MITRCASNCDCEWSFLHSYITNTRTYKDGVIETRSFLVCNECKEWSGKRFCSLNGPPCRCHAEAWNRAETVDISKLEAVDCL